MREWNGAGADRVTFADRLRGICHEVGFFRLVDHGVSREFLDDYFATLRAFFALPEATKASIGKTQSPWFRGWERVGSERTDGRVDHREQIDVWTELPPREAGVTPQYLRLQGPKQWLDDAELPGFRDLVERFQSEMGALADELLRAMSVGLGLRPSHLDELFGANRMSLVKLIHYPPTPEGEAGVNGHHDTGFLTLLLQHGVGGLQVQNFDGDWIDVPVDDESIVVNLGEMLQAMTARARRARRHPSEGHPGIAIRTPVRSMPA